jgi:aspartyl-tRNA(Asn)/glutamyl-tRNA(Gln) amidotransferase subunit C
VESDRQEPPVPISLRDVEYLAGLAKLELDTDEKTRFKKDLQKIIQYIDQLRELDTNKVSLTSHAVTLGNILREDDIRPSLSQDSALANAQKKKDGFFRVPRVLG